MDVHDPTVMQHFKANVHQLLAQSNQRCDNIQLDVAIHAALSQYGMKNLNQEKASLRSPVHSTIVDRERFTQMVLAHVRRHVQHVPMFVNPRVDQHGQVIPLHVAERGLIGGGRKDGPSMEFSLRPVFR